MVQFRRSEKSLPSTFHVGGESTKDWEIEYSQPLAGGPPGLEFPAHLGFMFMDQTLSTCHVEEIARNPMIAANKVTLFEPLHNVPNVGR